MDWLVEFFMDFFVEATVEVISELFPDKKLSTRAFERQKKVAAVVTGFFVVIADYWYMYGR